MTEFLRESHRQVARLFAPGRIELVVPICDAASRVGDLVDMYATWGLRPLFIVDQRSQDRSLAILRSLGARTRVVRSDHPRVESLLFEAIPAIDSEWVLRFDDDEAPSYAVFDWIARHFPFASGDPVGFSRRWVRFDANGTLLGSSCVRVAGEPFPDWQFRLFRPSAVTLTAAIHTPGFVLGAHTKAPEEVCLYHFDWIVRSYAERRGKVSRYEEQSPGAGLNFCDYYLPEDRDAAFYDLSPVTCAPTVALAARLAQLRLGAREQPRQIQQRA